MKKKHLILSTAILFLFLPSFTARAQSLVKPGNTSYDVELWLRADSVDDDSVPPHDGASIYAWHDRSGKGLHFVQRVRGAFVYDPVPAYRYNGGFNFQPSLFWPTYTTSTNTRLLHSNADFKPNTSNAYYVFTVSKPYGGADDRAKPILQFFPNNANTGTTNVGGTGVFWTRPGGSNADYGPGRRLITSFNGNAHYTGNGTLGFTADDRQYGLVSWIVPNNNSATGDIAAIYLNGRQSNFWNGSLTPSSAGGANDQRGRGHANWLWHTSAQRIQLGQGGSTGNGNYFPYAGEIMEVIVLSRAGKLSIDAAELQKIQTYLAIKYGLSLNPDAGDWINSAGAPVWDTTSEPAYNNNIFGIGRDDASGLYQKQSRSVEDDNLTVYVGQLETLNRNNTGTLADKQYIILGSNGSTTPEAVSISAGTEYFGGAAIATDLNFQSGTIYRAQCTNITPPVTVNFHVRQSNYEYIFVSSDETFTPATTKIYRITKNVAQVKIDATYKYIRLAGYDSGPGGVNRRLRLWLRADDEHSLQLENLNASDSRLTGLDAEIVSHNPVGVLRWSDLMRGHNYKLPNNTTRIPVYERTNNLTNYHPAVRFWNHPTGNDRVAYLANTAGILNTSLPDDGKHTAIFLTNNNFNRSDRIYTLMFSEQTLTSNSPEAHRGPGYGVYDNGNSMVGRFRTSSNQANGNAGLFNPGATAILSFQTSTNVSGNNNPILFRFSGKTNQATFNWNNVSMKAPSSLGTGYNYDRTIVGVMAEAIIYEDVLTDLEREKVESYLAIKYGITLRPDNTSTHRYHYKFSDGSTIWNGDQTSGKYVDYYNNIGAIIRDDASFLLNNQAHSTDAGSILHLGVAGTRLAYNGESDLGEFPHDLEAIVWGNDGETAIIEKPTEVECGGFDYYFKRKWLVRKTMADTITLLVGAQNNLANLASASSNEVKAMHGFLSADHNVYLIVAKSKADLDNNNFTAIVPMHYINGEHQCSYTFTDEETYITFGFRPNQSGCVGDMASIGKMTYKWSQWKRHYYGLTNPITKSYSLDDSITIKTTVARDAGISNPIGYPRTSNRPANGALEIRRRGGNTGQKVTVTMEFNHPVVPEFYIADIDGHGGVFEQVKITGQCKTGPLNITPHLSYRSTPATSSYKITGNTATATARRDYHPTNKSSHLGVAFEGGVTTVVIEYTLINRKPFRTNHLYISPVSIRPVPPPAPVNEHGMSFVKQVEEREITTCQPAEYSFYIENVNCEPKYVGFTDILPDYLTWEDGSLGLDTVNGLHNNHLKISAYGGTKTLHIDSLLVPGSSKVKLTATAVFDDDAPEGDYDNRATITYRILKNDLPEDFTQESLDRETLDEYTTFHAAQGDRKPAIVHAITHSPGNYIADKEITFTLLINNPNPPIDSVYIDLNWDAGFTYKTGSFTGPSGSTWANIDNYSMAIAGDNDGDTGFTLSTGLSTFNFTLVAPSTANLEVELDGNNQPIPKKFIPANIDYAFSTNSEDPCVVEVIKKVFGEDRVPYIYATHILTNRNITAIKRRLP
jgi:hypothetical protein